MAFIYDLLIYVKFNVKMKCKIKTFYVFIKKKRGIHMNIFYKAYARTYQSIFRMARPFMKYTDPKIVESLADIPQIICDNEKRKPLIVTDEGIMKLELINPLFDALTEKGVEYAVFKDCIPNPTTLTVDACKKAYIENECDSIIAFGGGSAMDCAKAAGALIARPKKELNKLAGICKVKKTIPLLIAVPTTCGTGSETTLSAVITDGKTRHKYVINDFKLIPSYAVLDHSVIKTLPPSLISTTGLDAFTHAIEAFIGNSTTKKTRDESLEAMKLIWENIEPAMTHEEEALKNMLYASHVAGKAFSVSYVGYCHAIAHALGGTYNIPHGYANAVILPYVLRQFGKKIHKKLAIIADHLNISRQGDEIEDKARRFIIELIKLEDRLQIDNKIYEIETADVEHMAKLAHKEANPLYPVPVLWDGKVLAKMFYKIKGNDL